MKQSFDVVIIGAGMAGVSLAAELASSRSVLLLEQEDAPGRHATGRSAAMLYFTYGNATVRALTRASRRFYTHPPIDFSDTPLVSPRSCLQISDQIQPSGYSATTSDSDVAAALRPVTVEEALSRVPILDPAWLRSAAIDDTGFDIDVACVLQGYLVAAKNAGVSLILGIGEMAIERRNANWHVCTSAGEFVAPVLVNAAGAWADRVAAQAGARSVGLQPLRRTAITLACAPELNIRDWPFVIATDESFYFKPDAGRLLVSPANEDPSEPCDAAADELDVAIAVDRFERATTVEVTKVLHRWAGLRSFVKDRSPVVGFDYACEGFFWLAGQGGFGIQTAPATARVAAALIVGDTIPADIAVEGVSAAALSPRRLR